MKRNFRNTKKNEQLRLDRVDLTGAQYLMQSSGLAAKSTENNKDLFKVDKDGNMTAVVFHFSYREDENGNTISQEVRTDIKVLPSQIVSYDNGQFLLFRQCSFLDAQGEYISISGYSSTFLVRAKDGAVFSMHYTVADRFPRPYAGETISSYRAKVDSQGDLFFGGHRYSDPVSIYKVELQGDKTVLKTLTAPELDHNSFLLTNYANTFIAGYSYRYSSGGDFRDGVLDRSASSGLNIFYPNGGFETIPLKGGYEMDYIVHVGTQLKRVEYRVEWMEHSYPRVYADTLWIRNLNITNAPPYAEAAPAISTRSGIDAESLRGYHLYAVIECQSHYVLEYSTQLVVCRKSDNAVLQFVDKPYDFSYDGSTLAGTSRIYLDTKQKAIKKYDFQTLTYSEVPYNTDLIGTFVQVGEPKLSSDAKTYTTYGVRNSDGRSIIVEIDVQTGAAKATEAPENRTITELIRLN